MDKKQAVDLINSMEIVYFNEDIVDGQSILYMATVVDNIANREVLTKLGLSEQQITKFQSYRKGEIDIINFVWAYANWFRNGKFVCA